MPIDLHWYARNAATRYPVDDAATGRDRDGRPLPDGVLVDLALRWPMADGDRAWVGGLTVAPGVAAATFHTDAGLLGVAAAAPGRAGRAVAVTPLRPGVAGWAVFGPGAAGPVARASIDRAGGLLALKAARPARPPGVAWVGTPRSVDRLAGVVRLAAAGPLAVAGGERTVGGARLPVAVLALAEEAAAAGGSVFRRYAGPCGGRPESDTCPDPQPVEFVAGVGPDCDGRLTLRFTGCVGVEPLPDRAGVRVHPTLPLSAGCPPRYEPTAAGGLPADAVVSPPAPYPVAPPAPPRADFELIPDGGKAPLYVQFADRSAGVVTGWAWDVRLAGLTVATLTARNPGYVFPTWAAWEVALTVTGPGGSDTLTRPVTVTG